MLAVRGSNVFNQREILDSIVKSKDENVGISSICFYFDYWTFVVVDGVGFLIGFIDRENELVRLSVPGDKKIRQASCWKTICLLVTEDGECWKYYLRSKEWENLTPFISSDENTTECKEIITKVCSGDSFQLVLSSTGKVYKAETSEHKLTQVLLPGLTVVEVACGREHAMLLTNRGQVSTWGSGKYGQLGHGVVENEQSPKELMALAGLKVTQIAAGGFYSCAVTEDGDLYTWGMNNFGQLGFPPKAIGDEFGSESIAEPRVVDWPQGIDVRVTHVSCGSSHTVALLDDRSLWGCGWNAYHQLSNNNVPFYGKMVQLDLQIPHKDVKKFVCGWWNTGIFLKK